jgi:LysM repeat protein
MWSARQVGTILAYAAIPLLLVVGSVALAVTEGAPAATATPGATIRPPQVTQTTTPRPTEKVAPASTIPMTSTPKAVASPTPSPTPIPPTASSTSGPQPTSTSASTAPAAATEGALSLPVAPRTEPCGPFRGWNKSYVVRPGDTLFAIALRYRTSVWQLRQANCRNSTVVFPGECLWVPAPEASHCEDCSLPGSRWKWQDHLPWTGVPGFSPDP